MPLDLTDDELATAAQACRAMAYQEAQRAKAMENPTTRGPDRKPCEALCGPGAEAGDGPKELAGKSARAIPPAVQPYPLNELSVLAEPRPCTDCSYAQRCGEQLLACSAFKLFACGAPQARWRLAPRVDASRERYEALMGPMELHGGADSMSAVPLAVP
jgi:MoaA/NifB/PqqE/SkfB family radical SAM enzyme